jgi:integrase
MARTVRDAKLETRQARLKLPPQKEPYWKGLDQGLHVGYYKGATGSKWLARFRRASGAYAKATLGVTDDIGDADGVAFLSFSQAQEKARTWCGQQAKVEAGLETSKPTTVQEAAEEYLEWFKANRKTYQLTKQSVELHVLPSLGSTEISKLTTRKLQQWLDAIATSQPRAKRAAEQDANFRNSPLVPEKRKATANRQLNILKAILNYAFHHGYVESDQAWRRLKPYRGVENAKIRYITEADCKRLINACAPDFRPLVQAALYTGCRYGELTAMRVADYNTDSKSVFIAESKSGKPRHIALNDEGASFFANATLGNQGDDRLFTRADGGTWQKSHQSRRMVDASAHAKIKPHVGFHILRHTYASQLAMKGVPLQVIATQLGHSDTRTCEKHYAHLSPSYVADTIRAHLPDLGGAEKEKKVTRLRK